MSIHELLSTLVFNGHSYIQLRSSSVRRLHHDASNPLYLSFHLYPAIRCLPSTGQHLHVLLIASPSHSLYLTPAPHRLVLKDGDRELHLCDVRSHAWSSIQLRYDPSTPSSDAHAASAFELRVLAVDGVTGRATLVHIPHVGARPSRAASVLVGGSPQYPHEAFFSGHIASLVFAPVSAVSPHPYLPRSCALQPLPWRALPLYDVHALHSRPFSPLLCTPHSFTPRTAVPPYLLHCHDFRGGYARSSDDWPQPVRTSSSYPFCHWRHVDAFVYFSHHRITIPPPSWTVAAHKEGVRVLGTVIVEWEEGARQLTALLDEPAHAEALVRLCEYHRFDGWLFNVEAPVACNRIPDLLDFLRRLRTLLYQRLPHALLLWYDSVSAVTGEIAWQSHLHPEHTAPFFLTTDGVFTDYHWKAQHPAESAAQAAALGRPAHTVWTGIDVWGRGTFGGGGWNTTAAMDVIQRAGTSYAVFGAGWTLEGCGVEGDRKRWEAVDRRLWLGEEVIGIDVAGARKCETVEDAMVGWTLESCDDDAATSREALLSRWAVVNDPERGPVLATSHRWCARWREIDLQQCGVSADILTQSPLVIVQPYRGQPPDPADPYEVTVELLSSSRVSLLTAKLPLPSPAHARWQTLSLTLRAPPTTRFLVWRERGRDAENWAGNYGGRIGRCRVEIRRAARGTGGIGRFVDRRLPCPWGRVHNFNVGCGKGRWREGRRVEGGEGKEAAVPLGQWHVREEDVAAGWKGSDWTNLEEQDVQSVLVDSLRGGVSVEGMTCALTDEEAWEGGTSVRVVASAGGEAREAEFAVMDFQPTDGGEGEVEQIEVCAVVKEGPAMLLSLVLLLKDGQRVDARGDGHCLSSLSHGGWTRYRSVLKVRTTAVVGINLRVLLTWPSSDEVVSYLGEVYLCALSDDPPGVTPRSQPALPSFLHYSVAYPDSPGQVTVFLVWLPPLQSLTPPYAAHAVHSYELEIDGRWVGSSRRTVYLLSGVHPADVHGKTLSIGWRELDGSRSAAGVQCRLWIDSEDDRVEDGHDSADEVAVWTAFASAFCVDDGYTAALEAHCTAMGLDGNAEQSRVKCTLLARAAVQRGRVKAAVREAVQRSCVSHSRSLDSLTTEIVEEKRRPCLRVGLERPTGEGDPAETVCTAIVGELRPLLAGEQAGVARAVLAAVKVT